MPETGLQIEELDPLGATPAAGDLFPVVDVSDKTDDAIGTTKYVTFQWLVTGLLTESLAASLYAPVGHAHDDAYEPLGAAAGAVGAHESSYTHVLHRGDWAAGTRYYPGHAVQWRGGAYLCLAETIGEEPDGGFDLSWQMLADGSGKSTNAVTSHVGLANPHTQYALRSEMPALIKASEIAVPEGNNSVALGTSKCQIEWIRITTTSTDWTLTLYSKSDYASGAFVIVSNRSGNHDIQLGLPYEDESAGGNLYYNFTSASGSETHSIEIRGVTLQ
jgi:hypothetical protein